MQDLKFKQCHVQLMVALTSFALPSLAMAENKAEAVELGKVEVISTTPLPGIGVSKDLVPSNVQSVNAKDLAKQHPDGSFEVLGRMDNSDVRGCNQLVV